MPKGSVQLPLRINQKVVLDAQDGIGKFEALITAVRPPAPLLKQPFWEFDWARGNIIGTAQVAAAGMKRPKVTRREIVDDIAF